MAGKPHSQLQGLGEGHRRAICIWLPGTSGPHHLNSKDLAGQTADKQRAA